MPVKWGIRRLGMSTARLDESSSGQVLEPACDRADYVGLSTVKLSLYLFLRPTAAPSHTPDTALHYLALRIICARVTRREALRRPCRHFECSSCRRPTNSPRERERLSGRGLPVTPVDPKRSGHPGCRSVLRTPLSVDWPPLSAFSDRQLQSCVHLRVWAAIGFRKQNPVQRAGRKFRPPLP
ncbi:hypothetical protein SKAU_G00202150 [Synaphobranchus kaupii]|uniref:Uncharacterized protein n=1 Tax=Synaphobranchus kaupii TaxID=118154 RepID=A0A9Q1FFM5_SYNKA|nr:hypothetical protein SKAU_G00202150 [Synaphobranchus kaupii]